MNVDTISNQWAAFWEVGGDLLAPIETPAQYEAALTTLEDLMGRESSEALDFLINLLSERLERYETAQIPTEVAAPNQLLAYLMDEHDLSQTELSKKLNLDQGTLSKILSGQRAISKAQAAAFAALFHLEVGAFIR